MSDPDTWRAVDAYFDDLLIPPDPALQAVLETSAAANLPSIQVSPNQGRLLSVLAQAIGARRILEMGTLGGYSAIWMARALPPGGVLVTLEADPEHAAVAQANIDRAGLAERVDLRIGPALESLPQLAEEGAGTFDLIFIDADKLNYPAYLEWALKLSHPGSLIVADNVVRGGRVLDPEDEDPNVVGARRFMEALRTEPRLTAAAVQTVGSKGYDGFAIAVVSEDPVDRSRA